MPHVVMIVDDSSLERLITETIFKRSLPADKIISFPSASRALEHLQLLSSNDIAFPRVILLDIHMPVMNGFDFLDKYLELPEAARQQCKIVMFSSTENDEDHERMRKYSVIHKFLHKPLSDEAIKDVSSLW